jgi:hypothetical protein
LPVKHPITASPGFLSGIVRSETFPGLWLDTAALLGFDLPVVLRTLQQGLAAPEHAAFVARLQAARVTS